MNSREGGKERKRKKRYTDVQIYRERGELAGNFRKITSPIFQGLSVSLHGPQPQGIQLYNSTTLYTTIQASTLCYSATPLLRTLLLQEERANSTLVLHEVLVLVSTPGIIVFIQLHVRCTLLSKHHVCSRCDDSFQLIPAYIAVAPFAIAKFGASLPEIGGAMSYVVHQHAFTLDIPGRSGRGRLDPQLRKPSHESGSTGSAPLVLQFRGRLNWFGNSMFSSLMFGLSTTLRSTENKVLAYCF